jgi:acyl-CoA reductase-like NAD-dependent aldehyde dehydrogenase
MSWKDESEVIARANNSRMGLGASVWTRDLARAEKIGRQLESGTVWINKHLEPVPNAPFGGHKESGIGVEYGISGLQSFCNIQTINIGKTA